MRHLLTAIVLLIAVSANAQNVGIGTSSPNPNAKLDITATDKGLLIPRMDSVHRKAIPNTVGLLVYDSTTQSFWVNNGIIWTNIASSAGGWSLTGNSGTTDNNFLGTTDNRPLIFMTANTPSGKIDKGITSLGQGAYAGAPFSSPGQTRNIVAIGDKALANLDANTINNTAIGSSALYSNTTGHDNTAVGPGALQSATVAGYNTAIGPAVLGGTTTGSDNTAVGFWAMVLNRTGAGNTPMGANTLGNNSTGSFNTAVGTNSLASNKVDYNSAFGYRALALNTTGTQNTAHGAEALTANTTGFANTGVGRSALFANTTGHDNTAIGSSALYANTTGSNNTAIGPGALQSATTAESNTAVGPALSANTTGSSNTAVGFWAMVVNKTGGANSALGFNALGNNSTGGSNTAIGFNSLVSNKDGNNNTAIGFYADAGVSLANATAIGANATVDASNKIRLGDNNVTVVESNGVFNTVSDGRFKYNIQEDVKGLDFIMQLRPVTYQFDAKKQEDFTKGVIDATKLNSHIIPAAFNENNAIKRTGFIAQEVEKAAQKTGFNFDGVKIPATDKQYYSLSYASFVVPLVKAMQEQQQTIEELEKQNKLLQQQNDAIIKRLEALEKK